MMAHDNDEAVICRTVWWVNLCYRTQLVRLIGSHPNFKGKAGKAKKSALLLLGISVVHSLDRDREWLGENYVQSTPTHKLGPLRTMQAMVGLPHFLGKRHRFGRRRES